MKYVIMFHHDDESLGIIETHETSERPEIFDGDYITLEKGERYKVSRIIFNHVIYMKKIFVYVLVHELTDEDKLFIDSTVG